MAERQRTKLMPAVPTLIELGYKDVDVSAWMGLLGPKGMPVELVQALNRHFNEVLKMPDVQAKFRALSVEPLPATPAETAAFMKEEARRWGDIIRQTGVVVD